MRSLPCFISPVIAMSASREASLPFCLAPVAQFLPAGHCRLFRGAGSAPREGPVRRGLRTAVPCHGVLGPNPQRRPAALARKRGRSGRTRTGRPPSRGRRAAAPGQALHSLRAVRRVGVMEAYKIEILDMRRRGISKQEIALTIRVLSLIHISEPTRPY